MTAVRSPYGSYLRSKFFKISTLLIYHETAMREKNFCQNTGHLRDNGERLKATDRCHQIQRTSHIVRIHSKHRLLGSLRHVMSIPNIRSIQSTLRIQSTVLGIPSNRRVTVRLIQRGKPALDALRLGDRRRIPGIRPRPARDRHARVHGPSVYAMGPVGVRTDEISEGRGRAREAGAAEQCCGVLGLAEGRGVSRRVGAGYQVFATSRGYVSNGGKR